jgi:hypothetical protein
VVTQSHVIDLWGHATKLRRHPFASPTKRSDLKFKLFLRYILGLTVINQFDKFSPTQFTFHRSKCLLVANLRLNKLSRSLSGQVVLPKTKPRQLPGLVLELESHPHLPFRPLTVLLRHNPIPLIDWEIFYRRDLNGWVCKFVKQIRLPSTS